MFRTRGLNLMKLPWQSVSTARQYQASRLLQGYPNLSIPAISRFFSVQAGVLPPHSEVGNIKLKMKKLRQNLKEKNKVPESEIEARRRKFREEQRTLIEKQAAAVAAQGEPNTTPRRPIETQKADDDEEDESVTQRVKNTVPLPSMVDWIDRHNLGRRRRHVTRQIKEEEKEMLARQKSMQGKFKFVAGAGRPSAFLEQGESPLPEVAFAGRSNVGKSSLINALALARVAATSPKPGTTRTIDWYLWPRKLLFVDVPGYGFAYAKEDLKESWQTMMRAFLQTRRNLKRVYLLVDSRHGLKQTDREMIDLLVQSKKKCQVVLTKELMTLGVNLTSHLHMVSAHRRQGLLALQNEIESLSQVGEERSREYTRKGQERAEEKNSGRYKKFMSSSKQAKRSEALWEHGSYRNWKDANADEREEEEIDEVLERSKSFLEGKARAGKQPSDRKSKWSDRTSPSREKEAKPLPTPRLVTEETLVKESPRRGFWDDFDSRVKQAPKRGFSESRGREGKRERSDSDRSRSSRPSRPSEGPARKSFDSDSKGRGTRPASKSPTGDRAQSENRDRTSRSASKSPTSQRAKSDRRGARPASESPASGRAQKENRDRSARSPAKGNSERSSGATKSSQGNADKPLNRRERRLEAGITKPGTLVHTEGRKKGKPSSEKRTVQAARLLEQKKAAEKTEKVPGKAKADKNKKKPRED